MCGSFGHFFLCISGNRDIIVCKIKHEKLEQLRKCFNLIARFAEQIHIPVVNTMMRKGVIPWDNRYEIGTIGIPQKDYINQLFEVSDLVLGIGYDLVEYAPQKLNGSTRPNVVRIGTKAADINKNYQTVTQVVGDISESIFQIMQNVRPKEEPDYAFDIKRRIYSRPKWRENRILTNDVNREEKACMTLLPSESC